MSQIAVVAIGGNALIKDKHHQTVADQYQAVAENCCHLVGLAEAGYEMAITHGNGPQVGFILLRAELASQTLHTVPLDSCGADTQGAIGYHIQRALGNEFRRHTMDRSVVTVVTQVVVDAADPAFAHPSKPIGPFYDEEKARAYQEERGWVMVEDAGRGYRRVVASPEPQKIVEIDSIKTLIDNKFIVISVGGGGIPVTRGTDGDLVGVEAVIDKDLASSLLAVDLKAQLLLICTSVDYVYLNYGCQDQEPIEHMTVQKSLEYLQQGQFRPGSMEPKIRAAIQFLDSIDGRVVITSLPHMVLAAAGQAGTQITR